MLSTFITFSHDQKFYFGAHQNLCDDPKGAEISSYVKEIKHKCARQILKVLFLFQSRIKKKIT